MRPTSIRIFLADGMPDGLRIVEKSNWTGLALVTSRADLPAVLGRPELLRPGVYVLTGSADDGTTGRIYVGEADVLKERLKSHLSGKEFWDRAIAFTSKDENLNKAHVRYLEARLLQLAKTANQWHVDNGVTPSEPPLSEADRADADWFLEEMLVIYPILGVDAFEAASLDLKQAAGEVVDLRLSGKGAEARGVEVKDGFIVREGSRARADETPSIHAYLSDLRKSLLDKEVIQQVGEELLFRQDYRFNSPSTAAGVVLGRAANGRIEWTDSRGQTLKELQARRAE